jgi:predicted nucleic acid-binding protein
LAIFYLIVSSCEIILAPQRAKVKCRDPDDQKFLDCAVAGKADILVTGDRDLLIIRHVGRTKIVTAAELIRTLKDPLFRLKPVKFREKIRSSEIDRFLYHAK